MRAFDVPWYPPRYWEVVAAFRVEAQWEEVKSLKCALGGAARGPVSPLLFASQLPGDGWVFPAIHMYDLCLDAVNKAS